MKSAIFTRAHAITRAAIQPGDDYRVTFAAALRIAYEEARSSARAQWAAMTPEQQYNALLAMAWHEYGQRDARSMIRDGQPVQLPNVFTWIDPRNPAEDVRAVAHDAYIRLISYLDDPRRAELPLSRLLSRAVIMAAQKIDRAERRNPSGLRQRRNDNDPDGEPLEYIDAQSPTAERAANPETAAIIGDSISRAAKDDTDRTIMRALAAGYSAREIAQRIGMSHTAVNKRVRGLRERYAAEA